MSVSVNLRYFALLRDQRGLSNEIIDTDCNTAEELFKYLSSEYRFTLGMEHVRVSANAEFVDWEYLLQDGDELVFIPPVAGG